MTKFDICYHENHVTIEPHFCREWDENGGCYGTNLDHGFTLQEAIDLAVEYHERQIRMLKDRTHWMVSDYEYDEFGREDEQ